MALPFPEGCPPDDAVSKEGTYYRLARRGLTVGEATTPDCWLRPYETRKGELFGQVDNVVAHALSLFATRQDLDNARDLNPRVAGKPVAALTIGPSDGVLKHTPTDESASHHDWWTNPFDLVPEAVIVEEPREAA